MNSTHLKVKKRGAEIVRSLLTEGYSLIHQSEACEVVKLCHRSNGNRMTVICGCLGVYVYKNGLLVKFEILPYSELP